MTVLPANANLLSLHSSGSPGLWLGFALIVGVMLALDLGVLHKRASVVGHKQALGWSALWVALSLAFAGLVYLELGAAAGSEFLSAYLIEKSLSIDNVFVFSMIFAALRVPAQYQHRVLFWGVLGALVMRALMIAAGAVMLQHFHVLGYVFGAFLVLTGCKLFFVREHAEPADSWMIRTVRRCLPTSREFDGERFFTRVDGKRLATPLLLALCVVELSDVVFALDSIPAVLAVSDDPFIVFSSNAFAMLGLRSLYVLLSGLVASLRHLKTGLAAVLVFVGLKMTLVDVYKLPPLASLAVICVILATAVLLSLRHKRVHSRGAVMSIRRA